MVKNLLLAVLCLCSAQAFAQSVFEVTLNPAPYSRGEAREQALNIVLARLSGEQAKHSWVQEEALSEISRYLASESSSAGYQARFNPQELQALLSSAGLPFAIADKPSLLVWLRDQGQVKNAANPSWKIATNRYQQPLLWPLWDLEEQMTLNDKPTFNSDLLRDASARYDAEYWLVVEQGEALTPGYWQLFSAAKKSPLLEGKLKANADNTTQLLAKINDYWARQAPAPTILQAENVAPEQPLVVTDDAVGELTIVVSGLRDFSDSVLLERKLGQINGVASVYVVESAGSQGRYRLSVPGSRSAILQALSTLNELTPKGERTFSWSGS